MFGALISGAIKVVTLPIDAANAAMDVVCGGDGSKRSRKDTPLIGDLEQIRDAVADTAKSIDD